MRAITSQPGGVYEPDPYSEPGAAAVGPWFGYLMFAVLVVSVVVLVLRENSRNR